MKASACRRLAVLMTLLTLAACSSGNLSSTAPSPESIAAPEMVIYPKEYAAFQRYLDVIRGRPGLSDTAVIEGTVTSIRTGVICPYQEEACRIEPYPDDWGTVRVDRILEYAPFGEPGKEPVKAEAGGTEGSEGQTSPGYAGAAGQPNTVRYEALQPGQELTAHFLLTARPARVRQLALTGAEWVESTQLPGSDAEQPVEHRVEPAEPTFEPVPREGEHFVFSTIPTGARDAGELVLPGLTVGSRFRATVQYDGTLYVQEYELIP